MTNFAGDVRPSIYSPNEAEALFNRWTGAAVLRDYSPHGALVPTGAGHSPGQPDIRFHPVCDFSSLTWYCANAITSLTGHYPDDPAQIDTNTGLFVIDVAPNTMPLNPHTYLGVQEFPAAWGGGPKGSLMQFSYAGSTCKNRINLFDVSKPTYGHSQLVTTQPENSIPGDIRFQSTGINPASYPLSARDDNRQGWWLDQGQQAHEFTLFCDKTGHITQYPAISGGNTYASLIKVDSKDLLIMIMGGSVVTASKMRVRDLATGVTNDVSLIGDPLCYNAGSNECRPEIAGFQWVEELNCIAGIDCMNLPMKFMKITPPATNPAVNPWTVTEVPMQHWTAGDPGGATSIRYAINGNFTKFQWVKTLNAFVLATSAFTKPQVFSI